MFLIKLINSHSRSPLWIYIVKRTGIVVFSSLTFLFISFHSFPCFTKCGFSVGNPKNLNRKTTTIHLLVYLPDLQKYKIEETAAFLYRSTGRGEKKQTCINNWNFFLLDSYHHAVSITGETWDFQWSRTFIVLVFFRAIVWPLRLRRCRFLPRPHRHLSPARLSISTTFPHISIYFGRFARKSIRPTAFARTLVDSPDGIQDSTTSWTYLSKCYFSYPWIPHAQSLSSHAVSFFLFPLFCFFF